MLAERGIDVSNETVRRWFLKFSFLMLLELDVPHTSFASLDKVMEQPHLAAVKLFQEFDHPSEGKMIQPRPTTQFSASPAAVQRLPPHLGERTQELLREVAYTDAEIDPLADANAVGVENSGGA